MKQLITNATLLTLAGDHEPRTKGGMRSVGLIRNGAVFMDKGLIQLVGLADTVLRDPEVKKGQIHDAGGRIVMPGFVDCHTHPVFGEARLKDFGLRTSGKSYQEIAAQGGGIVSSIRSTRGATESELTQRLLDQSSRFTECGTTTIEAKTGYGLDKDSELKALRAIKHVAAGSPLEFVPTFLGAHAIPPEYQGRPGEYVDMLIKDVLPVVVQEGLAKFVDAFCEKGFFSQFECRKFLKAGADAGLGVRIHAEQLTRSRGASLAAELKAASADHLDHADAVDLVKLREAGVIAALVPGSNHFLGHRDYPDARKIIDAGVPVALATDFNPGTCPCWNMQEVISIATTQMGMTVEEAIIASTINGAHALGLGKTHGSLEKGKQADVIILDCSDYRELAYWFGSNIVSKVFKKGKLL
ncbi:MAG: imidazolonepropionase [Elusimicrobia bacterium]|nr:MAG: imidazolonepropionase [Elusimicrobiota bacterium]